MNDNARKWIAALRSGDYKQTAGKLTDGVAFCCLGVACELYIKHSDNPVNLRRASDHYEFTSYTPVDNMSFTSGVVAVLSQEVKDWLGLRDETGSYIIPESLDSGCLATRNDAGATFDEIADIIESEPPGLFVDPTGRAQLV